MTVSDHFAAEALERLATVAPISYRKVFSGLGLYHQNVLFGLLVQGRVYFRTDELSRSLYQARQMPAFKPDTAGDIEPQFYQLPEEVLSHTPELLHWMRAAVEAAQPLPRRPAVEPVVEPAPAATEGRSGQGRALAG